MTQKNLNLKAALLKEMYKSIDCTNYTYKTNNPQLIIQTETKERIVQERLRSFFKEWNNG